MYPIVLVHYGISDYLEVCLALLRAHRASVVLLGDEQNRAMAVRCGVEHALADRYLDRAWERTEFGYAHNSYLPEAFERLCFTRFNALLNYAKDKALHRFIYLDSDIMILNRRILDVFQDRLERFAAVTLSEVSTFFSGWSIGVLERYIESLPSYFLGDPCGDRHCDMFAFKRLLTQLDPGSTSTDAISTVPVYQKNVYSDDPNYSFSPIVMKHTGVWGYEAVSKVQANIGDILAIREGLWHSLFQQGQESYRTDFVHLNGFNKSFAAPLAKLYFSDHEDRRYHQDM